MDQPEALQRLNAALDELEGHLKDVFAEEDGDASIAALREQIRFLTDERDQLLVDLEAERSRVRRLKAANDEVSGRLDVVMGTLKDIMPAMPS
jgi:chromosome segregation ATPase